MNSIISYSNFSHGDFEFILFLFFAGPIAYPEFLTSRCFFDCPHLIKQNDVNDSIRELDLSTRQAELLGHR